MSPGGQFIKAHFVPWSILQPLVEGPAPVLSIYPRKDVWVFNRCLFSLGPARELFVFTVVISSCTFCHLMLALLSETTMKMSQNIFFIFYLFFLEGGRGREKERENLKQAAYPERSLTRGQSHDLEIMTWVESKSQMFHRLSHRGTPKIYSFKPW